MPLIILGLIVVLGACLLIYYQLGPKVTLRLKSKFSGFAGGAAPAETQSAEGAPGETGADPGKEESKNDDDKVLYVFGDGGREERSFRKDDVKGEEDGQGEDK